MMKTSTYPDLEWNSMLIFNGGGGGTVMVNGVVMMVGGGGGLTNVVLHDKIEPYSKVQSYHTVFIISLQINKSHLKIKIKIVVVAEFQPWANWWFSWNDIVGLYILKSSLICQHR